MGEEVAIVKLARQVIESSGYTVRDDDNPDGDIEIAFSGLRPGEKINEELTLCEDRLTTQHPKIFCLRAKHGCPKSRLPLRCAGFARRSRRAMRRQRLRFSTVGSKGAMPLPRCPEQRRHLMRCRGLSPECRVSDKTPPVPARCA